MQTLSTRKPRKVYNAYSDIDCVTTEAGQDYINWIQISKEKLKEREGKLLQHKVVIIQSTSELCVSICLFAHISQIIIYVFKLTYLSVMLS